MKNLLIKKKSTQGMSLVELLLVVGLAAIILAGMFVAYNKVQSTNAANTESTNISTLRAGVKNLYGSSTSYNGLTNAVLLNARVVPDNMRDATGAVGATAITNSFGGAVVVTPTTFGTGAQPDNAFQIVYPRVPADVCAKLVVAVAQSFDRVVAGAQTVKDTSAATGNAINVANAATGCNVNGGASITMVSL